jgi:hypothetical protein
VCYNPHDCTCRDTVESLLVAREELRTTETYWPASENLVRCPTKFELIDQILGKESVNLHNVSRAILWKPEHKPSPTFQVVPIVDLMRCHIPARIWYSRGSLHAGKKILDTAIVTRIMSDRTEWSAISSFLQHDRISNQPQSRTAIHSRPLTGRAQ